MNQTIELSSENEKNKRRNKIIRLKASSKTGLINFYGIFLLINYLRFKNLLLIVFIL